MPPILREVIDPLNVLILWRGSPLVWESCRQPFTTLSSAESELVSMVHSIQLTESLQSLIDELLGEDSTMSLLGDNAAAVRAFDNAGVVSGTTTYV